MLTPTLVIERRNHGMLGPAGIFKTVLTCSDRIGIALTTFHYLITQSSDIVIYYIVDWPWEVLA